MISNAIIKRNPDEKNVKSFPTVTDLFDLPMHSPGEGKPL